jgi:hypothetical protein
VLDYSLLFVIQVFFGGVVSLPRDCAGLSLGWLGEFCVTHGAHLFGLSNVLKAGLEPVAAALKFSQCNMLWGSLPQAKVQGVEGLILVGVLFLPNVAPTSQGGFEVTELRLSASVP